MVDDCREVDTVFGSLELPLENLGLSPVDVGVDGLLLSAFRVLASDDADVAEAADAS